MTLEKRNHARHKVRNLIGGSIVALLILVGISIFGFFQQRETQVTAEWINHTQNVIQQLQILETQVYESVMAQRGFVITKKPMYENKLIESFNQVSISLDQISKLTRDNDKQQENSHKLREYITELKLLYSETTQLVKSNQLKKIQDLIDSGRGQRIIDSIKGLIETMTGHEEKLLHKRVRENEAARNLSYTIVITSSILALLFIIVVLYLMYKEFVFRLETQEALSRSSQFQEAILKATPFALVTVNTNGAITSFNPAAEKLLGYKATEVIGKNPGIWHIPEEISGIAEKLSERFGKRIAVNEAMTYKANMDIIEADVFTMVRKDGNRFKANLTLAPLKDFNGNIYGYISISYDITQQLEYEKTIIAAREQALAGTKAKSEFLANMSHEIRTPMNAIMGMAELLMEADLTEEQKKYVEIFQRAGDSLLNIINDILDLSKIEAGHFELDRVPFQFTSTVQKAIEIVALKAHQKSLELVVDIDEDMPDNFYGDANRIRQILLNLLGNSVKFTKKGEILLRIKSRKLSETRQEIHIEVQDTGIGMSEQNVKKLFERFAQADSSITKEFGGTGLGLSITKRLTELMGGEISVQSTQGVGSRFTVTIVLERDLAPHEEQPVVDIRDMKVLIVDDTKTNRLIIRKILEHMGAKVQEAEDGTSGLDLIHQHKLLGKPFEMILLDSRMPGMDGFTVAEKVQNSAELKGPIMMMLTSDNRPGDLMKSRQLGLKSYLVKPILKSELIEAINRASQEIGVPAKIPVVQPTTTENNKLRILLVDDNDENRLVIRSFLKNMPWKIDEARNGREALELYIAQNYDIIFMDMQMPIMDGYTATKEIRKMERENGSFGKPVLALTAYALKEEVDKSIEVGCNGHLTKPISKSALIAAIKQYTSDIEVNVDSDLEDLIPDYITNRHQELKELKSALVREDYGVISSLGHKLRGSAGSYGFDGLSEVGKVLEENGKARNKPVIENALFQYDHYLKKLKINYKSNQT